MRSRSKSRSLYDNIKYKDKKYKVKLGYSTAEKAHSTIKNIKAYSYSIQRQLVQSMLNRATYHNNQTSGMRDAIKIYKKWLQSHNE